MGTVFRAYDPNLGRDVALKLLPPEFNQNESFLLRFKREARVVARLEHPSIVPIYDVGDEAGRPYLVMRLLNGGTLRERLDKQEISQEEFLATMFRMAEALDLAHGRGIIHRDIKPTNIMFDEEGRPFLSDFGVAKDTGSDMTLTGQAMVGTPVYMSPEQFMGTAVDGRSDQYSLAVVIFEALTGQPPFRGNTMQIMYKHVHEEPPNLTELNKNLPPALAVVISRAMAKERVNRFPTVQAFVQSVRSTLSSTETVLMGRDYEATMLLDTASGADSSSRSRPGTPLRGTPPPTPAFSQPAATPAPAASKPKAGGRKSVWLALATLLLFVVLAGGWWFIGGGQALVMGGESTAVPTLVPATSDLEEEPERFTVLVSGDGVPDAFWQIDGELSRIPADGRVQIPVGVAHEIQSTREGMTMVLPDGSYLVLDRNTAVQLITVSTQNETGSTIVDLVGGSLLLVPNTPSAPIIIRAETGAQASTAVGPMGVSFNSSNSRFEVDCFAAECAVGSPTSATRALGTGQARLVNSSGEVSELPGARFDRFPESVAVLPTPTASPTITPTVTPTIEPTRTPTIEPTDTAVGDNNEDEDEEATPTVTPSPTAMPRSPNTGGTAGTGAGLPITFEQFGIWTIGDERNGSFTQSREQVRSGTFAGKLEYDFATTGNDYVVFLQFNNISGEPNALQMWVYGDGQGHYLNLWIQDAQGQTWQVPMGRVTHTGWRQMTGYIDPDQDWPWAHISGPRNDTVEYPIRFRGIVLDDVNNAYQGSGVIYVDDLTATTLSGGPPTGGSGTGSGSGNTSAPTAVATSPPVAAGDLGRIIYTSGNILLTTDPSWTSAQEIGTVASDTCSSPATTVTGQSFRVYYSPRCNMGEGTVVCASPNGAHEAIFNGSFGDGFTISVRPAGAEGSGTFIYGGKDFDLQEGIRWSPASDRFLFVLGDTLQVSFPAGGYNTLMSPIYNPTFAPDGSLILYRRPVGPGVNDLFVANVDGTNARNVTNNTAVDKRCAGWLLP